MPLDFFHTVDFPDHLPIVGRLAAIAQAMTDHQVVILAGETGSGKTTQLPKLAYAMGWGEEGMIGCTQPRRLAARAVCERIAEELHSPLGQIAGYKIRFADRLHASAQIKVMTDGILLAEIQQDPLLKAYSVIIVDEAHERSLNIDFLLGYLHQLLPRRPDLKLLITSATLDTEKFSAHFGGAPIIEVSGRTYPVEVRYRPFEDADDEDAQHEAILAALKELAAEDPHGDVLVFLVGEREIAQAKDFLVHQGIPEGHIYPLYARLSPAEQQRVFQSAAHRRIVLSTNVAETSLTVPGIRFVVDLGLARVSRYSLAQKIQLLPIEKISQAAANQRKGRCGRVSDGICIRLYDEEDFAKRAVYTEPEIHRTSLANTVLQLKALKVRQLEAFPFVDPPGAQALRDGVSQLTEIGALHKGNLTPLGDQLRRLPVDPKFGRVLLEAQAQGVLAEALVVVAALSVQNPRIYDVENPQKSNQAHKAFVDERSDVLFWLNLWHQLQDLKNRLSHSKLKKWAKQNYLSFVRLKEWEDIYHQLHQHFQSRQPGKIDFHELEEVQGQWRLPQLHTDNLHYALLSGFLLHLAKYDPQEDRRIPPYLGTRNKRLRLVKESVLNKLQIPWICAIELVQTASILARQVFPVDPLWAEKLAEGLIKHEVYDPHWQRKSAQVGGYMTLRLWGLPLVEKRKVNYGPFDAVGARKVFIQNALVDERFWTRGEFLKHNRKLRQMAQELEAQLRKSHLTADDQAIYDFYDQRIPAGIYSGPHFESWRGQVEKEHPHFLWMSEHDVLLQLPEEDLGRWYPKNYSLADAVNIPVSYRHAPGKADDGVSFDVPLALIHQVTADQFARLVPGFLQEKLKIWLKALAKSDRKKLQPLQEHLQRFIAEDDHSAPLAQSLSRWLLKYYAIQQSREFFQEYPLPDYLQPYYRIVDAQGSILAEGGDLSQLQQEFAQEKTLKNAQNITRPGEEVAPINAQLAGINELHSQWIWPKLPDFIQQGDIRLRPSLLPWQDQVKLILAIPGTTQQAQHAQGVRLLLAVQLKDKRRYLNKQLITSQLCLGFYGIQDCPSLQESLHQRLVLQLALHPEDVRSQEDFEQCLTQLQSQYIAQATELTKILQDIGQQLTNLRPLLHQCSEQVLATEAQAQLQQLFAEHWLIHTPSTWLVSYPRYLKALQFRLEKAQQDPTRDSRLRAEIHHGQALVHQAWRSWEHPWQETARWLLEELRVSVFAQHLGTQVRVSNQRIQKALQTPAKDF